VVLCLLLVSSIAACLGTLRVSWVYSTKLQEQLQARAATLADVVGYYAATAESPEKLQRFVRAIASSEEVEGVKVFVGNPPRLLAASDEDASGGSTSDGEPWNAHSTWYPERHAFAWTAPAMIASHTSTSELTPGVIVVELRTDRWEAERARARCRIPMMLSIFVGLLTATTYGLLNRCVLIPAQNVVDAIVRRAAGDHSSYAKVYADDELGELATALNSMFDVLDRKETERLRAIESLSASEALAHKLSLVASRTDNGVVITDPSGRVEWVNDGFTRMTGYLLDDLVGRKPGEVLQGPESSANTIQFMRERLAAQEGFSAEIINYHRSGHPYWVNLEVQPVQNDAGELAHIIAIQQDITARKEAQAEQQKFVSLVENSSDFIAMASLDGQFSYVNPAGCRLVALTGLGQAVRKKLIDLASPDVGEAQCQAAMRAALATGYWTGELAFQHLHRQQRIDVQSTLFVVRNPQTGHPTCLAIVCRDVTERKRAEERLLRSHEEIATARALLEQQTRVLQVQNDELTVARQKAEAAAEAKNAFLANMSHEIRTPMSAILGFADLLLTTIHDAEARDAVGTIQRNGEHLLTIINDILDISKIEAERVQLEQLTVDPLDLLREVLDLMRVRGSAKGLACNVRVTGFVPPRIVTDPTRLRQVLINLIGNAIKFTATGSVTVNVGLDEADPARQRLYFDVVDTGIGLSDEQITHLFKPFVQADNSMTRRFGGTGLGLTISQRFAQMLGGDIAVTSDPGTGSTFRFTIATGDWQKIVVDEPKAIALPSASAPGAQLAGRHFLLAEDGPDNQRIISFMLKKAGATVTVVDNGQLAVDTIAAGTHFDAILLDMQMPVLDGYEAAAGLRQLGFTRPIIALTAHAMRGDREKCLAAGCDDYSTKPLKRDAFLALLAAQLERCTTPACLWGA
jgi:PAS domain S-box-containing protein